MSDRLRLLLLQIRDDSRVRQEEFESFVRYSGLKPGDIDILNAFDQPEFPPDSISGYAGLLVGGASEASVLEPDRYGFLPYARDLLFHCLSNEVPVFASCFGFQLAVVSLGGRLVKDDQDFEMGTLPIRLTPTAQHDPLFRDTPDGFLAVSVHQERATRLPPNCELLAYTKACPHAFRVHGKPFWAFQFHPEVDRQVLIDRLKIYMDRYTEGNEHFNQLTSTFSDTPESNLLVRKFIDRVIMQ